MSTEKPTLLLIPGGWSKGTAFEPIANLLRAQGYQAETISLPSAGGPASSTVADDAAHIQKNHLRPLIDQGKEVVVVMHSYSGIPGTDSIEGFTRKDLAAQGKKGGVVSLVYITAFLVAAGTTVESFIPGGLDYAMTVHEGDITHPKNPRMNFFNDLDDESAALHIAALVPHAAPSFRTPLTYEGYRDVPTTYLLCKRDVSMKVEYQEVMAALPGEGVVRLRVCEGGHFPMFSVPKDVVAVIDEAASVGVAV